MSLDKLVGSFASFGFSVPMPAIGHVFSGFEFLGVILVTAIPFGIYDLVEAMDNVESAAAAGDSFPTTRVLTADGVVSLIGCLMGNPFILAVYIGHPGWKAIGGRIGYSAATGIMVILLSWFGIIAVMMSLIPVVAISPILLYIGMLIGAQAFQETPKSHAPAVILALVPHVAAWGKLQIDNALGAAGTNAAAVGLDKLGQIGILYQGLQVLGGGAILASLVLGSIAVFLIERAVRQGGCLRVGRRDPDVLRLHARRAHRLRPIALCGVQLPDGRGDLAGVREVRGDDTQATGVCRGRAWRDAGACQQLALDRQREARLLGVLRRCAVQEMRSQMMYGVVPAGIGSPRSVRRMPSREMCRCCVVPARLGISATSMRCITTTAASSTSNLPA